jgi:hypothetical protein
MLLHVIIYVMQQYNPHPILILYPTKTRDIYERVFVPSQIFVCSLTNL